MAYEKIFDKPYPVWHNVPTKDTPATAGVFEGYDGALEHIEDFLDGSTAVKPVSKTDAMTQQVGVDNEGKLFTTPGSGGGGGSSSADEVTYDNTESGLDAENVQDAIDEIASDFQDGCDIIVQAVTAKGQTPASNSPADIAEAISHISGGTFATRTFTINGTYRAMDDNVDGYSEVTVNVPGGSRIIPASSTLYSEWWVNTAGNFEFATGYPYTDTNSYAVQANHEYVFICGANGANKCNNFALFENDLCANPAAANGTLLYRGTDSTVAPWWSKGGKITVNDDGYLILYVSYQSATRDYGYLIDVTGL